MEGELEHSVGSGVVSFDSVHGYFAEDGAFSFRVGLITIKIQLEDLDYFELDLLDVKGALLIVDHDIELGLFVDMVLCFVELAI